MYPTPFSRQLLSKIPRAWPTVLQVRKDMPDTVSIFILPPSRGTLEQRLRTRQQDVERVIQRRLHEAVDEISHYNEFDYVIINDDFDEARENLAAIIKGNRMLHEHQQQKHAELLAQLLAATD